MSFANGRNFRLPLRLIVSGVGSGESANRRLGVDLPAISRPQKPIGVDDRPSPRLRLAGQSKLPLWRIHPLMKPISGKPSGPLILFCLSTHSKQRGTFSQDVPFKVVVSLSLISCSQTSHRARVHPPCRGSWWNSLHRGGTSRIPSAIAPILFFGECLR